MKKMLVIINPVSGKQQIRTHLMEVLQIFSAAGYELTVFPTAYRGHVTDLVREYGRKVDRIVVSGGDGTLNEAITGLMSFTEEERPVLGYLPSGSANDVAYSLNIPGEPVQAAKSAAGDPIFRMDLGRFEERFFTYVAGFGAFTAVTYETPQQEKNLLGYSAYVLEGAKSIGGIRPIHVKAEYDGITLEDDILFGMVSNARSVGGMHDLAGKDVGLDDGIFEVTLVRKPVLPLVDYPAIVGALLTRNLADDPNFYTFQANRIRFSFPDEIKWVLDGEFGGARQEAVIETVPKALSIVVPEA